MENPKTFVTFSFLLLLVFPYLQTGYIDVNRQLANLETINQHSNTLCYTEIFPKQFKTVPQVATAIAEFDTNSQFNYQIDIRIRKTELTPTDAKFMIFARSQVSVWNRIVFSYLATDNSDVSASTAFLQTQDLSGCGKILSQQFTIELGKKYDNLHAAIFLNGMDLSVVKIGQTYSNFQINLVVIKKFENYIRLEVKRTSPTQIYSVSVGYVVCDPKSSLDSFDFIEKTIVFDSIAKSQPFIDERKHQLDLKNSPYLMGIESFAFSNQKSGLIKSLALSLNEESLMLGSLDSTNLKHVQISFIVFRERMQCSQVEIIVLNEETESLQCRKCDLSQNRVPNEESDECVCKDGFYQIGKKCYQLPIGGRWNIKEKAFVCNDGLMMTYSKKKDFYKCRTIPKHKMWDAIEEKWQCINEYYEIDDQCLSLPEHSYYKRKEKKFACLPGYFQISGVCGKSYENEEWSPSLRRFLCKGGFYRIGDVCLRPFKNSFFDQITKNFICKGGFYMKYPGICQQLPTNMKYDQKSQKLLCKQNYYQIQEVGGCFEKPDNMDYDKIVKKFICQAGHHPYKGFCRKPRENEEWSVELSHFVCKTGTYRVKKQFCLPPKANSHYSSISQDFECVEGYYDVNSECRNPPKNMRYDTSKKIFICISGYEEIDDECVEVPLNKRWIKEIKRFVCVENFYQTEDESCHKLKENEHYIAEQKKISCKNKFFKIKGKCRKIPKYAKFVKEIQDFDCENTFYRKNDACESCAKTCLTCHDDTSCTTCINGFTKNQNGTCSQICGDGKKFDLACDDDNTDNGDGCSGNCSIEEGWSCIGGNPQQPDTCTENEAEPAEPQVPYTQIKMVGMSHLYGKIILNIKIDYLPQSIFKNGKDLKKFFRILTNSQIPLKISSVYIDTTKYTFVVLYDFNKYEPIPEYLTRIEVSPQMKEKYMKKVTVKPLFIRVNPALMALKQSKDKEDSL